MRHCLLATLLVGFADVATRAQDEPPANVRLTIEPGSPTSAVTSVAFTPDSRRLVTRGPDGSVQVWDVETGRRLQVLHPPVDSRLDGSHAAVALDGRIVTPYGRAGLAPVLLRIDPTDGSFTSFTGAATQGTEVAVSADGKRLALARLRGADHQRDVDIWDIDKPQSPRVLRTKLKHQDAVIQIAFSPDGLLATASRDGTARIWDLRKADDNAHVAVLGPHRGPVAHPTWAPDGKHLATASQGSVYWWDVGRKAPIRRFAAHAPRDNLGETCAAARRVQIAALFAGGGKDKLLVAWKAWLPDEVVRVGVTRLDPDTPGGVRELFASQAASETFRDPAQFSPDGRWLAWGTDKRVWLWPIAEPKKARTIAPVGSFPEMIGWGKDSNTIGWGWDSKSPTLTHALDLTALELRTDEKGLPDVNPGPTRTVADWEVRPRDGKAVFLREGKEQGVTEKVDLIDDRHVTLLPRRGAAPVAAMFAGHEYKFRFIDPTRPNRIHDWGSLPVAIFRLAGSPDGRFLLVGSEDQRLGVYAVDTTALTGKRLLSAYVAGDDWVVWTPQGYYAATPGGERMMGWLVQESPDRLPVFHPAARFRKQMYRPDIIKLVLELGDVGKAIRRANAAAKRAPADLKELLPPQVRFDVARPPGSARVTVTAHAEAAVAEQKVIELQLILDGRPAPIRDDVVTFKPAVEKGARASWTFELPPGPHRLAVLARSPDTFALANEVALDGPAVTTSARYRLHTVCVGVSRFANHGKSAINQLDLRHAADDARVMDEVLPRRCGGLFSPGHAVLLTDRHATRDAVLAALDGLKMRVEPGDLVVIHFSCHGERADDGGLFLLLHEADRRNLAETCLSGDELKEKLAEVPGKVLLLLDACHAGAVGQTNRVTNDLSMVLSQEDCGVAVIAAAARREFALERVRDKTTNREIPNGLFTWTLKRALEGEASADPYDGRVYVHDLFQFVYREVRFHSGGRQHPCLGMPMTGRPLALVWRDAGSPGGR